MSEMVRLGSVGLGWWGGVLAEGVAASGVAEVTACYARTPASRSEFAQAHGCEEAETLDQLLGGFDLDGVLVATPHSTHAELAIAAAGAGHGVFIDKPLTLTVQDANAVVEAAREAGVVLQVGHNRRRQQPNRKIKQMIDAGELGDLHHLRANHSTPLLFNPNLPSWRRSAMECPAGGMTALGVHQVDTFQYLAGPIARVTAWSKRLMPEGEVDDTTSILFEFESGATGTLVTSQATGPVVEVEVHGTEAVARNLGDGTRLTLQRRGSTMAEDIDVSPTDTIQEEMTEFSAAIRGEIVPETGGDEGRSVVAVLEAIIRSIEADEPVDVAR